MKKPQLVIMAAGLGSRFGGLKQMAAVDPQNHWIIDYSIFDAVRAGFGEIILIVKPENEQLFRDTLGKRIGYRAQIVYVHQRPDVLPEGFSIPEGRVKPWGTAHAVLCAKDAIDAPFSVINADDFYGKGAFKTIYDYLVSDHPANEYAMVGYQVENTLTENGHVARGVCAMDESGQFLTGIVERTHIEPRDGGAAYTEDDGKTFTFLPNGTTVSMNFWGFTPDILKEIEGRFAAFLAENLPKNPLKCEYFLPLIPNALIAEGKAKVRVLPCPEKWYGVTYQPDMPELQAAIARKKKDGEYPNSLWK
ncbi:MAG: nucleotidyltransferase [Clostridia bacterium]|nr:nucleotidyltransferase [Clostridia bacterium]